MKREEMYAMLKIEKCIHTPSSHKGREGGIAAAMQPGMQNYWFILQFVIILFK